MSAAVPTTTYAAPTTTYGGYGLGSTYGASYAAPTMSYAAPTTYAAPQMSYVPQPYGGQMAQPYLDAATITQQEKDATAALDGQATMQLSMLSHQFTTQADMIKAECERNITMATNQFQQQRDQAILALEQQQKQQEMQLNMAKQQRSMAIQQQAASMQSQATQYKLQMEMQQKMAILYSGAGKAGTGAAKDAAKGADKKKA